jgi:plastocyanin
MSLSAFRRARFLAIMCSVVAAAACSDSAAEDVPAETSAHEVAIRGVAFVPADIRVAVGTEVKWTNEDAVDHTVTSGVQRKQGVPGVEEDEAARPDGKFDSNLPEEGDTFVFSFDEPGTYAYYCDVHASMTGEITVE